MPGSISGLSASASSSPPGSGMTKTWERKKIIYLLSQCVFSVSERERSAHQPLLYFSQRFLLQAIFFRTPLRLNEGKKKSIKTVTGGKSSLTKDERLKNTKSIFFCLRSALSKVFWQENHTLVLHINETL